ncbi:uncharacterized protein J7T54_007382 [Emericellopsis cladophorae]|uniref:ASST-domain-containing protein n=1 Tax=Emericellopsis cladophorae TaxID=2686198 RepID=A0A9Q0BCK5_9HYPO|nr:uncharacterized protein J7T54_007382 [Emericellopsis cladophorae]KAI6780902.1 hypothetical protein J7T54_007382 [Emericellopsis cladophorae]
MRPSFPYSSRNSGRPPASASPWPRSLSAVSILWLAIGALAGETVSVVEASKWYDWGFFGAAPLTSYESFGAESPLFSLLQTDERCYDGLIFIEPRGVYVETPGPVVTDKDGNLIWMATEWGQAMDLKVQKYKDKDYITFWRGSDSGTFGSGSYIMLDETYELFKEIEPVGEGLTGDLHEFRITEEGTALMTIYHRVQVAADGEGTDKLWIYDGYFQEVDIATGELVFEWHASDHISATNSKQPLDGTGGSFDNAYDFFHINSIDKDANGNYLVSSRNVWGVACINGTDGSLLWNLGGQANYFEDLSDGAATDMAWNHHASWYGNSSLTLFDNAYNGHHWSSDRSRGLIIDLDLENWTAKVRHAYVAPQHSLTPSQGSVQVLPNGNVFVGWGHTPAFTEFTRDGEVLCDTHFGPIWFANFSWTKTYRSFKFPWVGKPKTVPSVAMRPRQNALFASWNGATEVARWVLQSSVDFNSSDIKDHDDVPKVKFETKIQVPDEAEMYVRVLAMDRNGNVLAHSNPVSRYEKTPPVRRRKVAPCSLETISSVFP